MRVREVGNFIREQRQTARLSLRNLSKLAGVSNPYLSQIERGLRRPSAEILQAIAKALRISAETLYVKAGILEDRGSDQDLVGDILRDRAVTEKQKQLLIQIYQSFVHENALTRQGSKRAAREPRRAVEPRKAATSRNGARPAAAKASRNGAKSRPRAAKRSAR